MVVLAILLVPLAATYMFGLLISMGISIWRLVRHDYGSNSDGAANLKPAMDTLYYLALLQGALFCYRWFFSRTRKALVNMVIAKIDDREVLLTYLREIRIGCEKDPSFARGRNLITHAVDLIGSKSHDDCVSGVKLLDTALWISEKKLKKARVEAEDNNEECLRRWKEIIGKHMMMQDLIISEYSSPVLGKLMQTLDPRGSFDRETRIQGARIVAHLALDIHLKQFPGAIQYICTLIGSFEEYRLIEPYNRDLLLHKHEHDWDRQASRLPSSPGNDVSILREAYEKLVLTGLCILRKLATHENNCKIMSHTQGLLPKIMAPLTSDIIHQFNRGAWSISVLEESLKIMFRLVGAPGDTGAKLRRQISSKKEAIGTLERILNCDCCSAKLQKRAIGILTQLHMDNQENIAAFIKLLVDIFADDTKDRSVRNMAGEALAKLSIQGGSNTSIILQVKGDVLGSLTKILLLDVVENKTCRIRAAEILEQMCLHHTQVDECLSKLKKAMTDIMPKVLEQILRCGLTKDETHGRKEADKIEFPEKEIDIENQQGNAGDKTSSFIHPQNNEDKGEVALAVAVEAEVDVEMDMEVGELDKEEDEEFHPPLLSLFVTVCNTFIGADENLASQIGGAVDAISLPKKLKEMVAANSISTVHCLKLMKLTCNMVISMMKHRGSYPKEDLESLMEALGSASESMSLLDISMIFASEDDGAATTMKPVRSLGSLVKEAKESVDAYFMAQQYGIIEPFASTNG